MATRGSATRHDSDLPRIVTNENFEALQIRKPSSADFVVIGNSCVDVMFPNFASRSDLTPGARHLVGKIEYYAGGNGLNVAINLMRLGAKKNSVVLATSVGRGGTAFHILGTIREHNIWTSPKSFVKGVHSAVSIVLHDKAGEPTFLHSAGASDEFTADLVKKYYRQYLASSKAIIVNGIGLMAKMNYDDLAEIIEAKSDPNGFPFVFADVNLHPDSSKKTCVEYMRNLARLLKTVDFIAPNEKEALQLTGTKDAEEAAIILARSTRFGAVVKLGEHGVLLAFKTDRRTSAGDRVSKGSVNQPKTIHVQQPASKDRTNFTGQLEFTGAGDSWLAAFAYGVAIRSNLVAKMQSFSEEPTPSSEDRVKLLSDSLTRCCTVSNVVASHCIMRNGATAGVPTYKFAEDWLKSNDGDLE